LNGTNLGGTTSGLPVIRPRWEASHGVPNFTAHGCQLVAPHGISIVIALGKDGANGPDRQIAVKLEESQLISWVGD
jgi:hypothetical protein